MPELSPGSKLNYGEKTELRKVLNIAPGGLSENYLDQDFEDMLVFCKIALEDPNFVQNGSYPNQITPKQARAKLAQLMGKYRSYTDVMHTDVRHGRYMREYADEKERSAVHRLDVIAQEIKATSVVAPDRLDLAHIRALLEETIDLVMIPDKK